MQQIPGTILDAIEAIQLPSMPQVLLRFLSATNDDQTSMADLARVVEQDPALSARVLTVANSPALRSGAEIKSLDQGLVVLGTRLMRTLASCLAIQSVFARTAGDMRYDLTGFWGHALRVGELASAIAARVGYPDPGEAYLAGLMHDIGQLLLLGGVGDSYGVLLGRSDDERALQANECTLLGTDHSAVGAWLVDQWNLSSFMADAVLFHHRPANEIVEADPLSRIVWSAHSIDNCAAAEPESALAAAVIEAALGITAAEVAAIRQTCSERIAELAAALGIESTGYPKTLPDFATPFEHFRSKLNDTSVTYSRLEALVRDMATMNSLQHNLTALCSEAEIVMALRESARILFGAGRIAFLFVQKDRQVLSGANIAGQPPLLQRLEIRLDSGQSLAVTALLEQRPASTFDGEPEAAALVDVQATRALGGEGILYVPLCTRGNRIGVMTYGVTAAQYARLLPRLDLVANFANLAAESVESWRAARDREQEMATTMKSGFEQRARKVVHEAGNPLAIIKNYLKIVSRKVPDELGVQQELTILGEEIDRVTQIVRSLVDVAEVPKDTGAFDVNTVIDEMLALYGETFFAGCGITVLKSLEPRLSPVAGDRDSFKQILFNLWKNASEAMPAGGRITISTRGDMLLDGQPSVEIHVSDSGPGLPPEVMQGLFKPLAPNRRPGHSGIGLSIVASLVERLGGRIGCQNQDGQGACFIILLPQAKGQPSE
ncbi:HDOD domain-containing protein [Geobacter sp. FeAm09]|uniref:HDOD domain-containing protein n=1 Tax=Geobacter sp. FeAm09 TaxID=2597769 RepID=UPI0011EF94D4|nr:HDOD domain-containing protein [Geobacter sp. FeAm09]QEM67639.1 HDOD domain-containing protein [Geobacter sp. FeAm09]